MGSTTVVDSLIVKLGLDPSNFTKGQKQAAAETVKLERQVKKSSDSMSRDLLAFTGKVLTLAAAAVAVKKFINVNEELASSIRQLGNDASNYKIASSELRNFGNIAEMNGGKAEDATKTIAGLSKAVYDLAYNGGMSESLVMLSRLGVQFQDTAGNMRDYKNIVLDTQAAIQGTMSKGTSRASAYQMLMQAGFDPGTANAILQGDVGAQLSRQQQRRQVSASDVQAGKGLAESATNRSQAIDAAAVRMMAAEAGIHTKANNAAAGLIDSTGTVTGADIANRFGVALDEATDAVKNFAHWIGDSINEARINSYPRGRAAYQSAIDAASAKNNLPEGMLAGVLQTESGFNPAAHNASGATGIAQLMPKYFPGAGQNPYADINTSSAYLRELHDSHVKAGDADDQGAWTLALQSYNAGQSRVRRSRAGGKPLAQETLDYPGKVLGYAAQATPSPSAQGISGGNSNAITFEEVNVYSNGKDGQTLSNDFVETTRRKALAAHADTGMQ